MKPLCFLKMTLLFIILVIKNSRSIHLCALKQDQIYLESFTTTEEKLIELSSTDVIHMRLDPPFDSRYLRILWMLDHLNSNRIKVMNSPRGIMNFNEKLFAYRTPGATPSFVGQSLKLAQDFVQSLSSSPEALILKPLDLYSGIGVEKLNLNQWEKRFVEKVKELAVRYCPALYRSCFKGRDPFDLF